MRIGEPGVAAVSAGQVGARSRPARARQPRGGLCVGAALPCGRAISGVFLLLACFTRWFLHFALDKQFISSEVNQKVEGVNCG